MKLTKEQCLELGKQYIEKHNSYPSSKKWTITTAGCSRARIYENWGSWSYFIDELKTVVTIPKVVKTVSNLYSNEELLYYIRKSAKSNNGYPLYKDFRNSNDYPSINAITTRFGSWEEALIAAGYERQPYKYELVGEELELLEALTVCFDKFDYAIPNNTKNIDKEKLLEFIASRQYTKKIFGYSAGGWNKFIYKVFPDKPKGLNYYNWLLLKNNWKFCNGCTKVKTINNFTKNSTKSTGFADYCKQCTITYSRNNSAKRKANKLNATPSWADLQKIKEIYDNCPEGYHVDHIIPLQGMYVCGLHVENNLQYLSASENTSKGNKYKYWWENEDY
jgi:hypothetical protein